MHCSIHFFHSPPYQRALRGLHNLWRKEGRERGEHAAEGEGHRVEDAGVKGPPLAGVRAALGRTL